MVKEFQPSHVPNFEELGFKVGPSFNGYKCPLLTPIQDGGFAMLKKPPFFIGVGNGRFETQKERDQL